MDPEQELAGRKQEGGPAAREAAHGGHEHRKRWLRRPALLARFPKLFWLRSEDKVWKDDPYVVQEDQLREYPELADDLKLWCTQVEPRFRKLDHRARILQNQFWRQHLALIIGGLVATSLGAIQAAVGGGVEALAVAQALLTGALAGLTVLIRSRRAQHGYLTARLRAERIKSEFFLFLARVGGYGERGDPAARLIEQVGDIETAEGAT
jgi:Protein of unknown function (DUF4231)